MSEQANSPAYSGGFLYSPRRKAVLLHKRDGNTRFNPNKWAFFGGLAEGTESPLECFLREVSEELGLQLNAAQVHPLRSYLNSGLGTMRHVFVAFADAAEADIRLGEGEAFAWIPMDDVFRFDLTEMTADDLRFFLASGLAS
ncbi:MAG: NUDIX domain-containing protein [Tepidisphaeraceae bacterium]